MPRRLAVVVAAALMSGTAAATPQFFRTPISFERNDGQFRPEVLFAARGVAGEVSVRRDEIAIAPRPSQASRDAGVPDPRTLRIRFAGANPEPRVEGADRLATRSHYYDGGRSLEHVPHFSQVMLRSVYPGIDLALHGQQGELEYDFVVAPGASPGQIRIDLADADNAWIDSAGNLVLKAGSETLVQRAPVAFQWHGTERVPVAASFALEETASGVEARFTLGAYDATQPLVIDPVLSYASYFGADTGHDHAPLALAIDPNGVVYFAHHANNVPTVTAFLPAANQVVYTTSLGGSPGFYSSLRGLAIRRDAPGAGQHRAAIVGFTNYPSFPACSGTPECPPHAGGFDVFVAELDANGTLARSRFLGGSGDDYAGAIAADAAGNLYVTGGAGGGFPTTAGALDASFGGGYSDVFVARLAPDQSLTYSTYLGGSGHDQGTALAVDAAGNVYVAGNSGTADFPLVNPYSTAGDVFASNFLAKLNPAGDALLYSTYLGIGGSGSITGIAVQDGQAVLASSHQGSALVARFDAAGQRNFVNFLGGSGADAAGGVAVAANGDIYITGGTSSGNFPVVRPLPGQETLRGSSHAFVARFRSDMLEFSTYLGGTSFVGGSGGDFGNAIAIAPDGRVWVAGTTGSATFPVSSNAYRAQKRGTTDVFLAAIASDSPLSAAPAALAFGSQSMGTTSPPQSITVTNTGATSATVTSVIASPQFLQSHNCGTLPPSASCTVDVRFSPVVIGGALNSSFAVPGSVSIVTSGATGPREVPLTGTARKSLVTHYYRASLGRAPDAAGESYWESEAERVSALGANLSEVWYAMALAFFASPEYAAFNRTSSGFLADLYTTFFNRAPDAAGLAYWQSQIDQGMPREVVLAAFLFSSEFAGFNQGIFGATAPARAEVDVVMDFYRGLLSRIPDNAGFNYWVGRFRAAQCVGAAAITSEAELISSGFALSPEYGARNRTHAQYVGDLYNAFMRRGGDLAGVQHWISQLSSGALTREQLRRIFLNSPEFQARVAAIVAQGCRP